MSRRLRGGKPGKKLRGTITFGLGGIPKERLCVESVWGWPIRGPSRGGKKLDLEGEIPGRTRRRRLILSTWGGAQDWGISGRGERGRKNFIDDLDIILVRRGGSICEKKERFVDV